MKLKNVTINNYKSFGEEDNSLFIDELNVVIGKNESGKSNIIDALANINKISFTDEKYFFPRNRKTNKDINIVLNFETYKNEKTFYGFQGNAHIELKTYGDYLLSGDLSEFISNNEKYNSLLSQIEELRKIGISFQNQSSKTTFNEMLENLTCASTNIFVYYNTYETILNSLKRTNNENYINIANLIEEAINFLQSLYNNFPNFIKIEDKMLSSRYNTQDILEDTLLEKFLSICNIDVEELVEKMNSTDISDIRNYERDINSNIKNYFTNEFNNFYIQENVEIEFAINSKEINIMVDTTQRYLDYDERSNGLKWYISAFIQLQYMEKNNTKTTKNNIILMDEPGVYLHANAQKELTKLFSNLIKNRNQIIYTTHSPFMVDIDSIQNVRTVIKDEVGFSHIYNKITTIPTSSKSTYDTITPLTNALGLNLNYNIGPNFNKKNIIVEGISDYFYLYGYYKSKNIKNVPNIIPSTGGNNIPAIASILFGWNCDFNILLDQDDKGRSVYDSINDSKQPFSDKLIFIDGNFEKILGNDFEIENLFSTNDQLKFGINNEDYVEHKYNYSYNTYNKILLQEDTYDETTIKNFEKVIEKLITEIVGD